jgi:hypothetical protein
MKQKLSILFLFISFSSFSQSISFDDIKNINSKESFDRFIIENGFDDPISMIYNHQSYLADFSVVVGYGHTLVTKIENKIEKESIQASYQDYSQVAENIFEPVRGFKMQFEFKVNSNERSIVKRTNAQISMGVHEIYGPDEIYPTDDYTFILNEVKNQCNFYKVVTDSYRDGNGDEFNYNYSCYTCPGSKYPGKICFRKGQIKTNPRFIRF